MHYVLVLLDKRQLLLKVNSEERRERSVPEQKNASSISDIHFQAEGKPVQVFHWLYWRKICYWSDLWLSYRWRSASSSGGVKSWGRINPGRGSRTGVRDKVLDVSASGSTPGLDPLVQACTSLSLSLQLPFNTDLNQTQSPYRESNKDELCPNKIL